MKPISITFLGTCSGGGPLIGRACSSTAINLESASWLVDCAEGTQLQILRAKSLRLSKINKIFVTHLHVDHVLGIIPLLTSAMYGLVDPGSKALRMQLYGPRGLRQFIRFNLTMTQAHLSGRYAVHELLSASEAPSAGCESSEMHWNEAPGRDIRPNPDGLWPAFETANGFTMDAGPLSHRVPCVGYVFREADQALFNKDDYLPHLDRNADRLRTEHNIRNPHSLLSVLNRERKPVTLPDGTVLQPPPLTIPGRKLVILGDTSDPSRLTDLAMDASFLLHECTNAWIPPAVAEASGYSESDETMEKTRRKAVSRGHSTAQMAGEFALRIRARRLYLNHFSTKFPPPPPVPLNAPESPTFGREMKIYTAATMVLQEIERQASESWSLGRAVAASDLMDVPVRAHEIEREAIGRL